jgi:hypothetical protein
MKSKHTPGKWRAEGVEVYSDNSRVCDCEPYETLKSTETCCANARLCASAPELLAEIKRIAALAKAGVVMRNETGKPQWSLLEELKTITGRAIEKVEGGE